MRRSTRPLTATTISVFRLLRAGQQRLVVAHHHLRDAAAIADIEEDQRAEIAHPVHPSEQHDLLTDL